MNEELRKAESDIRRAILNCIQTLENPVHVMIEASKGFAPDTHAEAFPNTTTKTKTTEEQELEKTCTERPGLTIHGIRAAQWLCETNTRLKKKFGLRWDCNIDRFLVANLAEQSAIILLLSKEFQTVASANYWTATFNKDDDFSLMVNWVAFYTGEGVETCHPKRSHSHTYGSTGNPVVLSFDDKLEMIHYLNTLRFAQKTKYYEND